jgi:hypothetical protein
MPETLVLCGGVPKPRRIRGDTLQLNVSPRSDPHHRVGLDLDAVAEHFLDNVPDVLNDLLEVAAYVYAADRLVRRGSSLMAHMGAEWRRQFRFRIPVRCPECWQAQEVTESLADALGFLSDDMFAFEFTQTQQRGVPPYIGFSDPGAQVIKPDEIILFSGGLDSTAGVVEELLQNGKKIALATHKSATFIAGRQDSLVALLQQRSEARRIFYAPVWVRKGQREPIEFTQRTRSFLFASLGLLVARMFGHNRFLFFENGITSFNLPVADHVIGTRASRTTHPRVLHSFERLFSLLLGIRIEIRNPYLWKTKADVVEILGRCGGADLISNTVSCANVRALPMTGRQCGVCSQCVERRFAILAAGLDGHEPADTYATDLLRGAHRKVDDLTMAECHVLRAYKLAGMSDAAFLANYGQVFRALSYLPGPPDENARRICELHRRYGQALIAVVDRELSRDASLAKALSLPATSLLAMINAPIGVQACADATERELTPSAQAAADGRPVRERRIVLGLDAKAREVIFAGGPRLRGVAFKLFEVLADQFNKDVAEGRVETAHHFVPVRVMLDRCRVDEVTLRKRVQQARRVLERLFLQCADYALDEQDIIQSARWKGYRLNPYVWLIDPSQLQRVSGMSRPSAADVTKSATSL